MTNKLKPLPKFKNYDEEAKFWDTHSPIDYMTQIPPLKFPNLKPSTETISLRLPKSLLNDIKIAAHKHDVPYQSLMKLKLSQAFKSSLP